MTLVKRFDHADLALYTNETCADQPSAKTVKSPRADKSRVSRSGQQVTLVMTGPHMMMVTRQQAENTHWDGLSAW